MFLVRIFWPMAKKQWRSYSANRIPIENLEKSGEFLVVRSGGVRTDRPGGGRRDMFTVFSFLKSDPKAP